MMTTTDATGGLSVSFEFFPPKAGEAEATFWRTIAKLEPVHPSFVSVTYGAGGTTRDRTLATVARIARETSLKPAAHLTCVGASKDEVNAVIREFRDAGVNHIANMVNCKEEELKVGMRVKPFWMPLEDGTNLLMFQPDR